MKLEEHSRVYDKPAGSSIKGFVFFGLFVVASFVGGSVYWAASSKLDGAVVAPASLVVEGNKKTVQHLDGGIVRNILVKDGDLVKEGQVLVELDSTELDVNLDVVKSQLGELSVRRARLLAQIGGTGHFDAQSARETFRVDIPETEWRKAYLTQKLLFDADIRTRRSEQNLLDQRVANLRDQMAGLQEQRASNERQLEITRTELANLRTLLEKGLVAQARVNSREIEIERLKGVDAQLRRQEAQARNQISELQLAAISEQTSRTELASAELAETEALLATLEPQYVGATERRSRVAIKAPVDGRVVGMTVFTAGGVLRAGAPVLDIVPENQPLLVEARINTDDIEKLSIGQTTRVRLSAFDLADVPEATGKIVGISADSFQDERTGAFFYSAKVKLDEVQTEQVASLELVPGMPADLFVNTGERTALSYLAQPLKDRISRTFIE